MEINGLVVGSKNNTLKKTAVACKIYTWSFEGLG
jgi:hypothetical protein